MSEPARRPGPAHLGLNFGRGLLMGAADVVPGVSGGTVALIVGIYDALVGSLRALAGWAVFGVLGRARAAGQRWREVQWGLLLPLGAGIASAIAVGAAVIPGLLERFPEGTRAVFFGLILGSVPLPWREIGDDNRARSLALAAGAAVVVFFLVGLPPREVTDPSLLFVFAGAAVAICAMILPGVSGAYLLLVLGIYEPTLRALRSLDVAYVAVFLAGAAVGLGSFAKGLETLLARQREVTMAVLVGFMVGALRALWPWQAADRALQAPPAEPGSLVIGALALVACVTIAAFAQLVARPATARL